jgi:hypothetical protein
MARPHERPSSRGGKAISLVVRGSIQRWLVVGCLGALARASAGADSGSVAPSARERGADLPPAERLLGSMLGRPYRRAMRRGGGGGEATSRRLLAGCPVNSAPEQTDACKLTELASTETCAECLDGLDNDGDGRVDCDDSDCSTTRYCKNLQLERTHFNDRALTNTYFGWVFCALLVILMASVWVLYKDVGFQAELEGYMEARAKSLASGGGDGGGGGGLSQSLSQAAVSQGINPLGDSSSSGVGVGGLQQEQTTMRLDVGHLDYWIEAPAGDADMLGRQSKARKQVLTDVSASFLPGTLTAVMGPSGCGKTVLLNVLSGRADVGEFHAMRAINGRTMAAEQFTDVMRQQAYVRQEDTHFEGLTVRETMMYSAMLALPEGVALAAKIRRVEDVMREVGLDICADALVGGVRDYCLIPPPPTPPWIDFGPPGDGRMWAALHGWPQYPRCER